MEVSIRTMRGATMAAEQRKSIIIRADGNDHIGAGHLMRCLTIADALNCRDRVCFWCADAASAELARRRGYEAVVLGTDYRNMLSELPVLEELQADRDRGERAAQQTLLVDSYYVNAAYLQALGAFGRVLLLEDVPGRSWPVDGVINYNAFAEEEVYQAIYGQCSDVCQYIGASYVPLRPQFAERQYQVREQVQELLLTTGGGDRENIAGKILEILENTTYTIHVVSGPYNPHGAWLARYAQEHPRVVVHRQVTEMAELMLQCDMAVTAGGTTIYELCALGVPFVCFSYAENQEALVEYAGKHEIGLDAGKYHCDSAGTLENIGRSVELAARDVMQRRELSRRASKLVDGRGAARLAEALLKGAGQ